MIDQNHPRNLAARPRAGCFLALILLVLLLTLPVALQAQFTFTTNSDGSLNIYQYTGSGGAVTIPSMTNNQPITSIGASAFDFNFLLKSIVIPDSITTIGDNAFASDRGLTNVVIGNGVNDIPYQAFWADGALANVAVGTGLTNIENEAFEYCSDLGGFYFKGNAPSFEPTSGQFYGDPAVTLYYLPGTSGWGLINSNSYIAGVVEWDPQVQTGDGSFGVHSNQFGFDITGTSNSVNNLFVVVEACTNLSNPSWTPIANIQIFTVFGENDTFYFSDPQWTNYPARFYKLSWP